MGVDPGDRRERRESEPLSLRALVLIGVLVGALYAVGMAVRGDLVPGLVGGALAAWLVVLVMHEAQRRKRRRR